MVAAYQSAQAIKVAVGDLDAVGRGVFTVDVWRGWCSMQLADAGISPVCPCCSHGLYPALAAAPAPAVSLCGRGAVQVRTAPGVRIDLAAMAVRLRKIAADADLTAHLLRFSAEGVRFSVFPDGRALLFGIEDTGRALTLYDRYVGARP
jgi:adenylyltransferase/sulfurtransferase